MEDEKSEHNQRSGLSKSQSKKLDSFIKCLNEASYNAVFFLTHNFKLILSSMLVSTLRTNSDPIFIRECLKEYNERAQKSQFWHTTDYALHDSAIYIMNLFNDSPKEYQAYFTIF